MSGHELQFVGGHILEIKEAVRDGVPIGVFLGYLSTWEPDTGGVFGIPDQFHPGTWLDSLQEHKDRGNRPIRLKDHHGRTIGGFPIDLAYEDDVGLAVTGEINLDTQFGKEAYSLARQRVLTDLSAGYIVKEDKIDGGIRHIFKSDLWEGSIVDEPANRGAQITEVKSVSPFQDLPLVDRGHEWNEVAAEKRVRQLTSSNDQPTPAYSKAFVISDEEKGSGFEAFVFQIADVVDGTLVAVPKAIYAVAEEVKRSSELTTNQRRGAIQHLERYFAKMNASSPFSREERQFFGVDEVKTVGAREIETALHQSGMFSKGAATILASQMAKVSEPEETRYDPETMSSILRNLRESRKALG
jgi:HK97 family phage prohead protease